MKHYMVTVTDRMGRQQTDTNIEASCPLQAVKIYVRKLGGGALNTIDVSEHPGGILMPGSLKPFQLIARTDLMGGTRESSKTFIAATRTNWCK